MKLVYISHPLGAGPDREENRQAAIKWCLWAVQQGVAPVADWIIISTDERSEIDREKSLRIDCRYVEMCDELWLCGPRVSAGMAVELAHARKFELLVRDFTECGDDEEFRQMVLKL